MRIWISAEPDRIQLLFQHRITKRTPGRFRTRIVTDGVIPSVRVEYKDCRIKQYLKEGRALRTETTINNAYDFAIGRRPGAKTDPVSQILCQIYTGA
ncbi:MAG TPA: hypothetical protein VKZ50_05765 [bacterium]|nr:hypothetical protein [bacterium]